MAAKDQNTTVDVLMERANLIIYSSIIEINVNERSSFFYYYFFAVFSKIEKYFPCVSCGSWKNFGSVFPAGLSRVFDKTSTPECFYSLNTENVFYFLIVKLINFLVKV